MEKFTKIITNRMTFVAILILFQIGVLAYTLFSISQAATYINWGLRIFSLIVVVYVLNKPDNPSYKLAWIILILLFPIFGGLFYIIFGGHRVSRHIRRDGGRILKETEELLAQDPEVLDELRSSGTDVYNQAYYLGIPVRHLKRSDISPSPFPIYKNTSSEYLNIGEAFHEKLLQELEKAESYIFMEYFIIEEGVMWESILEILKRKAAQGVDVRILYDDIGCIMKLPRNYYKELRQYGISCRVFNPFRAHMLSVPLMNNRDHRKITVIDGCVGFTGGANLADEYINVTHPFGHWKDSAVMLRGEAVWSLTVMFLRMWNFSGKRSRVNYQRYSPYIHINPVAAPFRNDGYVMPYGDSPMDDEIQAEMVYLNIINRAKRYLYITTPYLIIDNELETGLCLAAKSGVDVRIITPHRYDKWYVHLMTRANYTQLLKAGVKIYEYTPGFIHAKSFVCDDEIATVGTVNLDYRSLYLHFECGTYLYKTSSIADIKKDFLETLEKSHEITEAKGNDVTVFTRILRALLRVFAPLL